MGPLKVLILEFRTFIPEKSAFSNSILFMKFMLECHSCTTDESVGQVG